MFGTAPEGQEDSQRTAALRRAYHRALLVPTAALDALWTGYERFENGTGNKTLAKRALDEWRPRFQGARGLVKDRTTKVEALDLRALPLPPGRGGAKRAQQATSWRVYLEWECSNPQQLDQGAYHARVLLAYEQALAILLMYPDVWLDFARWHATGGGAGPAAAKEVLHRGRRVLPGALSLQFAAAEAEESSGAIDKAKEVYEELVEALTEHHQLPQAAPVVARQSPQPTESLVKSPSETPAGPPGTNSTPPDASQDIAMGEAALAQQNQAGGAQLSPAGAATTTNAAASGQPISSPSPAPPAPGTGTDPEAAAAAGDSSVPPPAAAAVALSPQAGTLVWIQYMRFARRTNGMMAARKLFLRARKWPGLRWEAFVASASMEWAMEGKDQIPRNIYELGLKSFLSEPQYVLQYAAFLQGLGDTVNARSLFERALTATPPEASGPLYDAYLRLEAASGTLGAVTTVEQRRREALGATTQAGLDAAYVASLKYDYLDLSSGLESALRSSTGALPPTAGAVSLPASAPSPDLGGAEERRRITLRRQGGRGRSRSRSRSPPPGRGGGGGGGGRPPPQVADPSEPIRHFPRELAQFLNQLPRVADGPVPDIEKVIDVILRMDFSLEGIEVHEAAAARERRRQRVASMPPGSGPPGGSGGGGFGAPGGKRKAEHGHAPVLADSDSGGSSDEDGDADMGGYDVYRRRMRAKI